MSVLDEANRLAGWIARRQQLADAATVGPWSPTVGGVVAPYPEPLSSYGGQLTARTLAAGAAAVFGVALLSAGLAYAIAGCLLAWWLLVDLGSAEA